MVQNYRYMVISLEIIESIDILLYTYIGLE
jgi:hypothetical protein